MTSDVDVLLLFDTNMYYRGCVVTMECVEKLIKKDMLDPINGKKMTEKDIIPLQRVSRNNKSLLSIQVYKCRYPITATNGETEPFRGEK